MKKQTIKTLLGGIIFALSVMMPAVAIADQAGGIDTPMPSADSKAAITGSISAKSEKAITVNGQSIALDDKTSVTKGSDRLSPDDLQIGDTVAVTTAKQDDGTLVAVTVEVLPAR